MGNIGLIDKLGYYMEHSEDENVVQSLFSEEERQILNTIREFERLRAAEQENAEKSGIEGTLQRLEVEKDISFQLKNHLIQQIDILLAKEDAGAWMEILTWYQWINAKQMLHRFWEFHILKIVLDIFIAELKVSYSDGSPVSVLAIHSMEELLQIYFSTVFLLRRIEYGVEPIDEIVGFVKEYKLSPVFISGVVREAKINDKERVLKVIESWCFK